jgi:hypothetical protein
MIRNAGAAVTDHQIDRHGANWAPLPQGVAQAYTTGTVSGFSVPMFPSLSLGGYIQYGKNYAGNGPHGSGTYVYAFFINNAVGKVGSSATLGRCLITAMPNLVAADWTYYQGGDGMVSGNWGAYATSVPIFGQATPAGSSPKMFWANGQYLPAFGCYVMTPSFWPAVAPSTASNATIVQVWKAYQPWGPWTQVGIDWNTTGFYSVGMAPNSVATDGGKNTMLMAGGDFVNNSSYTSEYNLHLIPMTLS